MVEAPVASALVRLADPSKEAQAVQLAWISFLVVAASCATLVLELVAGRLVAPYVGVSLDTWTSIIGVVLAGVSLGNWVGGKLADRYPTSRTLGILFVLGGLATLAVLPLLEALGNAGPIRSLPLLLRIFALTTALFLPAALLLSMSIPVAIRLSLREVAQTGRVVGLIYAGATLGSLIGTFVTGFLLVAYFPTDGIVLATGGLLILLGLLAGRWRSAPTALDPGGPPLPAPGGKAALVADGRAAPLPRWLQLRGNLPLACGVVMIASFCTMAIELAASRVLAPVVGVSLYSWTGIIGVVLAGIAVGNYLGGRIADRSPRQETLGWFLFLSGFASLAIVEISQLEPVVAGFNKAHPFIRITAITAIGFFVPVALLGTISPQITRLAMTDVMHAGRISGRIYAWSTAGAIVGTFATGWWLVSMLGVFRLISLAGIGLLALALTAGLFWRRPAFALTGMLGPVFLISASVATGHINGICTVETNYFCIRVVDTVKDGQSVKALILDQLTHSLVNLGDPSNLGYEHEYVGTEVARYLASGSDPIRVLVIGGGGYTFPRWVEMALPSAIVDVVEIDPGVTEVAHNYLGLSRQTRLRSYHMDGRRFVTEVAPRRAYDLVVLDAVNDLAVPYHLLTKEFNESVRELLAPGGIYLATVIDLYQEGQVLRSALRTMMLSFPEVRLMAPNPPEEWYSQPFVVFGAQRQWDEAAMYDVLHRQGADRIWTMVLRGPELRAYVDSGRALVLTDRYAPVDQLIEPLMRSRS